MSSLITLLCIFGLSVFMYAYINMYNLNKDYPTKCSVIYIPRSEDINREVIQLNKIVSIIEATTMTLEKNSFNNVTMIQFQGLQELIYQQKDALMTLKTDNMMETGPMDMTPMFYELQNRIMELERRVDDHHKDWN